MKTKITSATDIGAFLKQARKELGLTQRDAAQFTGVSPRLWSECETGKRVQVGFETVLRMLQTVGVDLTAESRRPHPKPIARNG